MSPAPDFVLVGAMKAGSTTLHRALERHPALFLTRPKEPEFFSLHFGEPGAEAWYEGLFREARPGQLRGEASTGYTRWPQVQGVPERLAARRPDARLLYAVRHPVERAISHWRHRMLEWMEEGRAPRPLLEAVETLPEIVDSSRYLRQIERWLVHFPREQLHVIVLDDLEADPRGTLAAVQRFLGVAEEPALAAARLRANQAGQLQARGRIVQGLARAQRLPVAPLVRRLLPARVRLRIARGLLDSPRLARLAGGRRRLGELPVVDEATRRELHVRLDRETAELARWLARPLPGWRAGDGG